jgi:hypothetical protein
MVRASDGQPHCGVIEKLTSLQLSDSQEREVKKIKTARTRGDGREVTKAESTRAIAEPIRVFN